MSKYPAQLDDDVSLTRVDGNVTEIGDLAINQLRSAVFAVEAELGLGLAGSSGNLADRLGVSINANGSLKPSAIIAAGALVGPIVNDDVAPAAGIAESKLSLTYSTQSLYNEIVSLHNDVNNLLNLTSNSNLDFIKHLTGQNPLSVNLNSRHVVSHIDINAEPSDSRDTNFVWPSGVAPKDKTGVLRGSNLADFLYDLNDEIVRHQNANGTSQTTADLYGHSAAAISVDASGFENLSKSITNVQSLAEAVDQTNLTAVVNHQQNHHTNGISRTCRGSILSIDGYGQSIIPYTAVKTYLAADGASTIVDNNVNGDDIVEFVPTPDATFYFDSLFSQVKSGDVLTVNYGSFEVQYLIDSVRFDFNGDDPPVRSYLVRINGRNVLNSTTAVARIDRPNYSDNKYGVLTLAQAENNFGAQPSLIVGNPKGASVLGLGFSPSEFDSKHYNLYLELYPNGNPFERAITLPAIDVTGNKGITPGLYTLDSIVKNTNEAFRKEGFNYRFIAFSYNGEFGIMLADYYNNASFSIISGVLDDDSNLTTDIFVNNVVGDSAASLTSPAVLDPLGFGAGGANVASPLFRTNYSNINQAQISTKIFVPIKYKNYYVNGNERSSFKGITDGYLDSYSDGYWLATTVGKTIIPSTTVKVQYEVPLDLRKYDLRPGKTLVVQPTLPLNSVQYNDLDYGRFIISNVTYNLCDDVVNKTTIEVYNGVHATGTPVNSVNSNIPVKIYFSDDSVGFNELNIANPASAYQYKRFFEVYVDQNGHTFTHERLRYNLSTENALAIKLDVLKVSPKLRGYANGNFRQIVLQLSYSENFFTGYLKGPTVATSSKVGGTSVGKIGETIRFYDETGLDYIDIVFDISTFSSFINPASTEFELTFDLFPSLELDQEVFFLGNILYNSSINKISYLRDGRQFGNVSEQEFSTSAIDFVTAGDRFTQQNGVVRGLEYISTTYNTSSMVVNFRGGLVLVNGKYLSINNFSTAVPIIAEDNVGTALWALCIDFQSEIRLIPITISVFNDPGSDLSKDRVFKAYNPATNQTYYIESVTFTNLITKRKDLTPIAFINSTVNTAEDFTCTVTDARKIIRDDSASSMLVWTSDTASGNFATFEALNNWLIYNSTFNNTVRVRGSFNFSDSNPLTFNYFNPVKFVGDGAVFNMSGRNLFTIGNNIEFDGIKFSWTPTTDGSYSSVNLINSTSAMMYCNVGLSKKNITFKNCEFISDAEVRHPFLVVKYTQTNSYVQNLKILDNRFFSNVGEEDKRAVVAIVGPANYVAANPINTAYLINGIIEGNVCEGNQMFSISSEYDSNSGYTNNAVVTLNCRIAKNICGAINFLTLFTPVNTYGYNPDPNSFLPAGTDKDNHLIIEGNTCKFIYMGNNKGNFLVGAGTRVPLTFRDGRYTGSFIIKNNNCSWIHLGYNTKDSETNQEEPSIIVSNNKLTSYNSSFLDSYYNGFTSANIAIIVDRRIAS